MKQEQIESREIRRLEKQMRQLRVSGDNADLFGDNPPEELLTDYPVEDMDSHLGRQIQRKYKNRGKNIRRCWNRIQLFLPELMHHDGPSQKCLEMSTAHGGMLEILRYFGHEVMGNDYVNLVSDAGEGEQRAVFRNLNDETFKRDVDDYGLPVPEDDKDLVDWPYRSIIESVNIPMALFDAGRTPYPFKDNEFDVLMCMQAIEHYCHPKDWLTVVDEFCRITRKSVVIMLNPMMQMRGMPDDYAECFHQARRDLRNYRKNGFTCTSCHMHWGEAVGFKLTADG